MRDLRLAAASIFGIALAVAFPFLPYGNLAAPTSVWHEIISIGVKVAITAVLVVIGFAVCKRTPDFYFFRPFGWRDVIAMLAVFAGSLLALVFLKPVIERGTEIPDFADSTQLPLAVALASVLAAGITEEFIYRRFLIEELGGMLHSRWLAAAISLLSFTAAHAGNGYGWSTALLVPGIAGLGITVLYFWRKSLPLCMLMHTGIDILSELARRS
jgi:membrane protease YdiL (CAAX protease family)